MYSVCGLCACVGSLHYTCSLSTMASSDSDPDLDPADLMALCGLVIYVISCYFPGPFQLCCCRRRSCRSRRVLKTCTMCGSMANLSEACTSIDVAGAGAPKQILERNFCVTSAKKNEKMPLIHVKQHLGKGSRDIQPPQTRITTTAFASITDKFAARDCQRSPVKNTSEMP